MPEQCLVRRGGGVGGQLVRKGSMECSARQNRAVTAARESVQNQHENLADNRRVTWWEETWRPVWLEPTTCSFSAEGQKHVGDSADLLSCYWSLSPQPSLLPLFPGFFFFQFAVSLVARRCKSRRSFVACQSRAAGERRLRRLPLATAYSQQALRRSTATNAFPTKRFGSSGSSSRSRGRELAETVVAVAATRGQRGGGGVGTAIICLV